MFGLDFGLGLLLLACIAFVCVFEFINGFHDTANAVATVIYTNTLKPQVAVVYSAILNALGVYLGGIAVAVGIINMLPVETLVSQNTAQSHGMVGAILITAIFWNFGTWYLGIPASSTHTLVGSILGSGIAYSLLPGTGEAAVNWKKASEVGLSLLISPLIGFLLAVTVMGVLRWTVSNRRAIFQSPEPDATPPFWIRAILVATCGMVSYSHGSNDGQKGIGLMMLVLIGILPAQFALSDRFGDHEIAQRVEESVKTYDALAMSANAQSSPSIAIVVEKLKPEFDSLRSITNAQGASAELVAASTIGLSSAFGLPVSTTQVLSSGIAGSMFASGGLANLQKGTITKIALAWALTFPVCLTMSGTLYLLFRAMLR